MTIDEAKDFLRQAMIAFPGLAQWIRENSPSAKDTIETWANALLSIDAKDALSVLSRWISGELQAPVGYQKEAFVFHVKGVVAMDRGKRAQQRAMEEIWQKSNRGYTPSKAYVLCEPVIDAARAVRDRFDKGLINEFERDREIESIVEKAIAKLENRSQRIPA